MLNYSFKTTSSKLTTVELTEFKMSTLCCVLNVLSWNSEDRKRQRLMMSDADGGRDGSSVPAGSSPERSVGNICVWRAAGDSPARRLRLCGEKPERSSPPPSPDPPRSEQTPSSSPGAAAGTSETHGSLSLHYSYSVTSVTSYFTDYLNTYFSHMLVMFSSVFLLLHLSCYSASFFPFSS